MPTYSQADRPMAVTTPLGTDAPLLQQFSGTESLSARSAFSSTCSPSPAPSRLRLDPGPERHRPARAARRRLHLNGIVIKFSQGGQVSAGTGNSFFIRYQAEIVPQFWLLTRNAQTRIFQQITVPDILKQVLTGLNVAYQIQGTYKPRDYCVQYRETDFNFASRLMEEEGIYYFFTHADGSHQMVVADTPQSHPDVPAQRPPSSRTSKWEAHGRPRQPGRRARRCVPASTPSGTTASSCPTRTSRPSNPVASVQVGTVSHTLKVAGNDNLELYDFPGDYAQRFDGIAGRQRPVRRHPEHLRRQPADRRHPDAAGGRTCDLDHGQEHVPAVHRRAQVHARAPFQRRRPYVLTRSAIRHHGRHVHDRPERRPIYENTSSASPWPAVHAGAGDAAPPDRGHADRRRGRPPARRSSPTSTAG